MELTRYPVMFLIVSFVVLWLASRAGHFIRQRTHVLKDDERQDFGLVLASNLTLLGLLIGFSFSMAVSRYEQRKVYEEEEANAIGTEYLRADFLPAADAAKVRGLLKQYLQQRILFYNTLNSGAAAKISADTANLQNQLWAAVRPAAEAQPNQIMALVVSGMNDVLNSQSYTQAAWWNRIPVEAWWLMVAIAICCNIVVGYGVKSTVRGVFLIVPSAVSISFLLIADIDSPNAGAIRIVPQNLESLAQSVQGQ